MVSLEEFENWALSQGQVANPNGTYPGQCVSLTQQYLDKCYGIPYAPRGNAKDFIPPKFHRLSGTSDLQPGDIVRYGANYGGGYGHIGITMAVGMVTSASLMLMASSSTRTAR